MKPLYLFIAFVTAPLWLLAETRATGVMPETSVVIVEEKDGEGAINLKNTDDYPVLLLSTLQHTAQDNDALLTITPPAARIEPGKTQRVRFILTTRFPLKIERLKRVIFEGIPPQTKDHSLVRMTVRQNLPVIIRPVGLPADDAPWKQLIWTLNHGALAVSNPSPYVVRLAQGVTTLPDNTLWMLPYAWILPGQRLILANKELTSTAADASRQVRLLPASTWGFMLDSYYAPLLPEREE